MAIERFWRKYKYEFVYLWGEMELKEVKEKTREWVEYRSSQRQNQASECKTPNEVYYGERRSDVA